ncbi:hypothetical protein, partial [Bacteroides heparinolyticus]|uniref:hypothetical protein n=2 Tax=Prevotella heparinolytica TaxID=28113 RepID=UPI00359F71C7
PETDGGLSAFVPFGWSGERGSPGIQVPYSFLYWCMGAKLRIKTTYGRRFYSKHYIIRIIICIFVARINGRSFGKV